MPVIQLETDINPKVTFVARAFAGLVWLGTVIRRLGPEYGNFEQRISAMGEGTTLFPAPLMDFAIQNWFLIYLAVISIELISGLSLLTGTFARGGALLATINGFGIGMAGLGLGLIDLLIPWSVAVITLFLLLFTHPGRHYGFDENLSQRDLPKILAVLT